MSSLAVVVIWLCLMWLSFAVGRYTQRADDKAVVRDALRNGVIHEEDAQTVIGYIERGRRP